MSVSFLRIAFLLPLVLAMQVPCVHGLAVQASIQNSTTIKKSAVVVQDDGRKISISIGGRPFTQYEYTQHRKPIFYPVFGPQQISFTRNWPMEKVNGEADDHPHHKSMWIGHQINGVDFWSEKNGSVRLSKVKTNKSSFSASHDWIRDEDKKVVVSDEIHVAFGHGADFRFIDYTINFLANNGPVVFEDTKEGFFAVRVAPDLRSTNDPDRSVDKVFGSMANSEGRIGKTIWGKKARWVDYFGEINGKKCGIAIFDHPENLRHPTTWHARDYGLLAANPFGIHHFQNNETRARGIQLEAGQSLSFRYRVLLHLDDPTTAKIERHYSDFINSKSKNQ